MRTALGRIFILVVTTCISVSQISCRDAFGAVASARTRADKDNPLRATIGLRQIGTTWICFRSNHGKDEWLIDQKGESADKCVQYDLQGKLLWEDDSYLSGRSVWMDEQTVQEQLIIHYDYGGKRAEIWYLGNDPAVTGIVAGSTGVSNANVFAAGDKVLASWKLSRL